MAATSARNLVNGSGTVTGAAGSRPLVFSSAQDFKEGATVIASSQKFTIDTGAEKNWTTIQAVGSAISGASFTRSDTGTGRNRGGGGGGTSGEIVPGAMHFLYRAALDGSGTADWYFYFDTLFPENGVHPYTKDQYAGVSWVGAKTQPALVPNLGLRIRVLEGAIRGGNGDITTPDKRIADLIARVYALEQWANRVGTNTPPSPGDNATYTVDQLQSFGDIA